MENPLNSCVICFNEIDDKDKCVTNCNHTYCNHCIMSWFNKGKLTCPSCRTDVDNFINNGTVNRLIKIETRNNIPIVDLQNLRRIHNQNIYLKFIIIINVLYTFYNVYRVSNYENLYYRYKDSYQNCSDVLEKEIIKSGIVNYCGDLINNLFSNYNSEYITKCFSPLSFMNRC